MVGGGKSLVCFDYENVMSSRCLYVSSWSYFCVAVMLYLLHFASLLLFCFAFVCVGFLVLRM